MATKIPHIVDETELFFYPKSHRYARIDEMSGKTVWVPGVTSILSKNQDNLTQWAVDLTLEKLYDELKLGELPEGSQYWWKLSRETSGSVGSAIHKIIQDAAEECIGRKMEVPEITFDHAEKTFTDTMREEGRGTDVDLFEESVNAIIDCSKNVASFFKHNEIIPLRGGIEVFVWYRDIESGIEYCGRADMFCMVNGIPTVLDIKTSKNVKINDFAQLAAYRLAQKNMKELTKKLGKQFFYGNDYVDLAVLHIDHEKGSTAINRQELMFGKENSKLAESIFLNAAHLKRLEKEAQRVTKMKY